ncbi:MAG: hypothetical protein J6S99_02135 [Bacteroidales bacterium]|nr:hypothetical protein [Bacteroidales bacterium]
MAEYFENLDFIRRTKKLVKDYDGDLEASLLVNCAIGLLFVAKEKYGDTLSLIKDPAIIRQWGIDVDKIDICKRYNSDSRRIEEESKSLRAICRHLRNSFAHCNFTPINQEQKIVGFKLKDFHIPNNNPDRATVTFKAEIEINQLRTFLNQVADYVVRQSKWNNLKHNH